MKPIDVLLAKLTNVKGKYPQFYARCPAHDDRGPSLAIKEREDESLLISCKAGCETSAVLAAMELSLGDLYPEGAKNHSLSPSEKKAYARKKSREEILKVKERIAFAFFQVAAEIIGRDNSVQVELSKLQAENMNLKMEVDALKMENAELRNAIKSS